MRKGAEALILRQCQAAALYASLACKDKKEAGQAIRPFVYLNTETSHEKDAESHCKGRSMPGAKREPSPGQKEQARPR